LHPVNALAKTFQGFAYPFDALGKTFKWFAYPLKKKSQQLFKVTLQAELSS